ncbi:hypothetical protein [Paenibacillus sp. sgz500958]
MVVLVVLVVVVAFSIQYSVLGSRASGQLGSGNKGLVIRAYGFAQ